MPIPIVDLFAGPGGLGEGFASLDDGRAFDLRLSVEKDQLAHRTLWLRSLYRHVDKQSAYDAYRRTPPALRPSARQRLIEAEPVAAAAADQEAWLAELGPEQHTEIKERIAGALGSADTWALIGGPPCQAYSLVGRSRMRRIRGEAFEQDERHRLYQEYLKIIADHHPSVFIMENVKGLLSSELGGGKIFERILNDLEAPGTAVLGISGPAEYSIYPVVERFTAGPGSFVVRAEEHGIPQARHRVILLGVRKDVGRVPVGLTRSQKRVSVSTVIGDLPSVRSGLSQASDSARDWHRAIEEGASAIVGVLGGRPDDKYAAAMRHAVRCAETGASRHVNRGGPFLEWPASKALNGWYADPELGGITGHESRAHMKSDLWRYLYAAAFAQVSRRSITLRDFPPSLLPAHRNVTSDSLPIFADRFRVQLEDRPATTVTSHISKDGHGFIHYDAAQVRSLTAREAARLQTFPDTYEFEGPRTAQLHQIGNAVPPLLARQLAEVVRDLLA